MHMPSISSPCFQHSGILSLQVINGLLLPNDLNEKERRMLLVLTKISKGVGGTVPLDSEFIYVVIVYQNFKKCY